ncbi:hypothetical protein [Halocalculus aciditolerans]|uniref:Uncharacterized protein n=1 Tax=Halocalculus aciditolerans TaxID=1383812 RepID=A0A830FNP1_9EURY|nr:hypothetical protein [Halocalculus aciditolerans]GGL73362.1 hypothetical protein GCM10009039_34370 [Halocalculus aciditolerans]
MSKGQSPTTTNGTPPTGHDWGERTKQSHGDVERAPGHWETDAHEIRQKYGISKFEFDPTEDYQVYPDVIIHETKPEITDSPRATNSLIEGPKGSGKTTMALDWAHHQMEVNNERVLWRGDARRSGWLPYRHWTTVYLPGSVEYEAAWMLEGEEGDSQVLEPVDDLDDVARDVVRYEDVDDLLAKLSTAPKGSFNVIYPDPAFSGCEDITRESEVFDHQVPFVPKWETEVGESSTPTTHWWFAFLVARIERGPFTYQSLFFDELADWMPENASNHGDNAQTATKIRALRSVLGESRRRYLSIYAFCQEEVDLAAEARRRFDWRIAMPGRPNPCKANNDSRVGFRDIPMEYDTMGKRDPGTGLVYNETEFNWFTWDDVDDPALEAPEGEGGRWMKIAPTSPAAAGVDAVDAVEYDSGLFSLERRGGSAYLVVSDPGKGYLDVETGMVGEELDSPRGEWSLEVRHDEDGRGWTVMLVDPDSGQRRPVAKLDFDSSTTSGSSSVEGAA